MKKRFSVEQIVAVLKQAELHHVEDGGHHAGGRAAPARVVRPERRQIEPADRAEAEDIA